MALYSYEGGPCSVCEQVLVLRAFALRCSNGSCINHQRSDYYAQKRLAGDRIAHVVVNGASQAG